MQDSPIGSEAEDVEAFSFNSLTIERVERASTPSRRQARCIEVIDSI